jgi:hypothetical protein
MGTQRDHLADMTAGEHAELAHETPATEHEHHRLGLPPVPGDPADVEEYF